MDYFLAESEDED
uniref:Trafficking protein particle complex subunit 8 isoform X2 n=1 Tax=Rhizophora mucronata TaxID=61149 RepID=A0A2P2ML25_RHIMU